MGFIEKRPGEAGYRARFRDPLGEQRSKTFARKADAQRFLYEMETDKARGTWIDPRGAELPLASWAEEFLRLCRRLSPLTLEAYQRDLGKYVLPRFAAYRLGRIPADEIENWLNDEIEAGIAPLRSRSRRSPWPRRSGGRRCPTRRHLSSAAHRWARTVRPWTSGCSPLSP